MKFTCTKDNFIHALQLVSPLAGRQVNLPILHNILLQVTDSGVTLISTNLETAIRVQLRAKVETTGSFTLPAKTLSDYIPYVRGDQVTISLEGNEVTIEAGEATTKLKGTPADEFPVIPTLDEEHHYVIPASMLRDAFSDIVFATAKNEIRPELAGVCTHFGMNGEKKLLLAATDSYRLGERSIAVNDGVDDFRCIIPGRTVSEFIRLLGTEPGEGEKTAHLYVGENQIALRYGAFDVTSRLIDGNYPDYTQIIPTHFTTQAVISKQVLLDAVKAASIFSTTGVNAVHFVFRADDGRLSISSMSSQTGEHTANIDTDITGDDNEIFLNYRYVLDGLNHLGDNIVFKMNNKDSTCVLTNVEDGEYLYLIMPIRQ